MMAKHDDQYGAATAKARTRHAGLCADAQRSYDKVADPAAVALQKAQEAHDRAVAEADAERRAAEQVAHAELARAAKAALSEWTAGEREALGVPADVFLRRSYDGKYHLHASTGTPSTATAMRNGPDEWIIDSETGRQFLGGTELQMRRALFTALMKPRRDFAAGEIE